jgi:hypothetical protein
MKACGMAEATMAGSLVARADDDTVTMPELFCKRTIQPM